MRIGVFCLVLEIRHILGSYTRRLLTIVIWKVGWEFDEEIRFAMHRFSGSIHVARHVILYHHIYIRINCNVNQYLDFIFIFNMESASLEHVIWITRSGFDSDDPICLSDIIHLFAELCNISQLKNGVSVIDFLGRIIVIQTF